MMSSTCGLENVGVTMKCQGLDKPAISTYHLTEEHMKEVKTMRERIAELEKDAARLDFLETTNVDGEGLRYEVNCFVVDGENKFTIYDEVKEGFVSGEWSSDFRAAIDTAMQKD